MKIGFVVGEIEQHQMELSFDQPSGDLRLLMDGTEVLQDSTALAVDEPGKSYELSIGDQERHKLEFQLTYGGEPDRLQGEEPSAVAIEVMPRLSLMVTAVGD